MIKELTIAQTTNIDIQITTLTNAPHATEIVTCCICGIQRDRAVANEWREIIIEGTPHHACADEFPSIYSEPGQFHLTMQFAIICALNDQMIAAGMPPHAEAEALRNQIRAARQKEPA